MKLRDYQIKTIDLITEYFKKTKSNLCVVLPTGSGKSHIIAELCKKASHKNKDCLILMLTHSSELVKQNKEKLICSWKKAPVGIYSASMNEKDLKNRIIFATIQSLARAKSLPKFDLVLIDECHRVNAQNQNTQYIKTLEKINPKWVIGFTATPFRTRKGYLNEEKNSVFKEIIQPVSITDLWQNGYISRLKTVTEIKKIIIPENIKLKGDDYDEKDLNEKLNTTHNNLSICSDIASFIKKNEIKSCLIFCIGILHAEQIANILNDRYEIHTKTLSHKTSKKEKDKIIKNYKNQTITAITNTNILTTGFDAPDTNCIVFLRPTLSTSLYVQMAGRGMRLKSNNQNVCYVLDFVGNISRHGSLENLKDTYIKKKRKTDENKRTYTCIDCKSVYSKFFTECPNCGKSNKEFLENIKKEKKEFFLSLHKDNIMFEEFKVNDWGWKIYINHNGNKIFAICYKNNYDTLIERFVIDIPKANKKQKFGIRKNIKTLKLRKINLEKIDSSKYVTKNDDFFICAKNELAPPWFVFYTKENNFKKIIHVIF